MFDCKRKVGLYSFWEKYVKKGFYFWKGLLEGWVWVIPTKTSSNGFYQEWRKKIEN